MWQKQCYMLTKSRFTFLPFLGTCKTVFPSPTAINQDHILSSMQKINLSVTLSFNGVCYCSIIYCILTNTLNKLIHYLKPDVIYSYTCPRTCPRSVPGTPLSTGNTRVSKNYRAPSFMSIVKWKSIPNINFYGPQNSIPFF